MPPELPLAHSGHWYEWIPYLIPVVIVLAVSFRALIQQRREQRSGHRAAELGSEGEARSD